MHFAAIDVHMVRFHGQRECVKYLFMVSGIFSAVYYRTFASQSRSTDPKRQQKHKYILVIFLLQFKSTSNLIIGELEPVVKIYYDTFWSLSRPLSVVIDFDL